MLEEILDRRNLEKALKAVISNKGNGGVDGMQTDALRDYLTHHYQVLKQEILDGMYQPSPVRKVTIPKAQGGTRMLGIPTVKDRFLQSRKCGTQWLSPKYEVEFSKNSYGFRPNRNVH
jgi:RNA-directed DNA polymerase